MSNQKQMQTFSAWPVLHKTNVMLNAMSRITTFCIYSVNYCEPPHWEKLELPQRLIDFGEDIKTNDFGILGGLIRDAKNVILCL